jgi:WD40 repeat protein
MASSVALTPNVSAVRAGRTASLIYNNLQSNANQIMFAHKQDIIIVNTPLPDEQAPHSVAKTNFLEKDTVSSLKFCKLQASEQHVIVATTDTGLLNVLDASGQQLLGSYKFAAESDYAALRGITSDGGATLFVGTCNGTIIPFTAAPFAVQVAWSDQCSAPITCLASNQNHQALSLYSGDEKGTVTLWSGATKKIAGSVPQASGQPCTSLVVANDFVIAAYSTGHIRLFGTSAAAPLDLQFEICAHARCINALAFSAAKSLLVAAAEDSYVTAWSVPRAAAEDPKNIKCRQMTVGALVGVCFPKEGDASVASTSYDSRYIFQSNLSS